MKRRDHSRRQTIRLAALAAALLLCFLPAAPQAPQAQPGQPGAEGRPQGRRGPRDPFAGQPRVNALMISGGCCHDYIEEDNIFMKTMATQLPVEWTVIYSGRAGDKKVELYNEPDWAAKYDIVVHNECYATVDDREFVKKIVDAHAKGVPAMVIHCSMHSYRSLESDEWREFLGVTTRRHTAQHNISVKVVDPDQGVLKGFKTDWVTPMDELYVIDKLWPNAKALATAVSPEDNNAYPMIWTNDYHGARVFGTTVGHSAATWDDPAFQDLLVRGFKWAVNRE
jgi:type 1 glutamine amidotransferase